MHKILPACACLCIFTRRQVLRAGKFGLIFLTLLVLGSDLEGLDSKKIGNKLAHVKVGGKWGYIDSEGKMVINPHFDDVSPFLEVGSSPTAK